MRKKRNKKNIIVNENSFLSNKNRIHTMYIYTVISRDGLEDGI